MNENQITMTHEHPYFTVPFSESLSHKPHHLIQASKKEIIEYLITSHRRFSYQYIPQIEQSFLGLIKIHPKTSSLKTLFNLFLKFQLDLQIHAELEEQKLYKEFLNPVGVLARSKFSHEEEEPILSEIIAQLKKLPISGTPFYGILLIHLQNFNRELEEHAWIEENLVINKLI